MATKRAFSAPAKTLTEQKYVSYILKYSLEENLREWLCPNNKLPNGLPARARLALSLDKRTLSDRSGEPIKQFFKHRPSRSSRYLIVFLVLLLPLSAYVEWAVREPPDLHKFLQKTREDRYAKRYDLALKKHIWFHQNALKYDPDFYGVRLSFALHDWFDLSKVYPPALLKLQEIRNRAGNNVRNGINIKNFFQDYQAINLALKEREQTVSLFKWLDSNQPSAAKEVYSIAQPSLVNAHEYHLCGKYIDSLVEYNHLVKTFRTSKAFEKERNKPKLDGFTDKNFANKASVLVALLVHTKQDQKAQQVPEKARQEFDNKEFWQSLQRALQGQLPEPWPY